MGTASAAARGRSSPAAATRVTVHEIFSSLQGETTEAGRPCTFVRLSGCDLRCSYCDTPQAFHGGERWSLADVVADVVGRGIRFVTVTGGEPLLQPGCRPLVTALLDALMEVQVETGGHRDTGGLDPRARVILDLKAPGSGHSDRISWSNVERLRPTDQVKMVLGDRADYEWARTVLATRLAGFAGPVLLQPVTGGLDPAALAEWIVGDRLPVRLTLQLHAILWPGERGR